MGEQFEAPDRAHRQRERVGDRGFVPAPLLERVDAAPDIDAVHRGADQVFREGLHRAVGFVAIGDDHVDGREAGCNRRADAAGAGLDDELAVLLDNDGRLNDADRLDRGEQLLVHCCGRRGDPGIVRVGLQGERADTAEFRHDGLLLVGFLFPLRFGDTPLSGRVPAAGARAKPATPGRRAIARRTLAAAVGDAAPAFVPTSSEPIGASVHRFCLRNSDTGCMSQANPRALWCWWMSGCDLGVVARVCRSVLVDHDHAVSMIRRVR